MKKIKKNAVVVIFICLFISIINKLIYTFSTINNKLYKMNSYYYEWKFGKIHYTVSGSGNPILLIHSMKTGASSYEFNKIAKNLSKKHTVYTIDLIGYGKSEKPRITYTAFLYVQLISDFITDVIEEPVDIITSGKSNAYITMLVVQEALPIKKLIFINPGDLISLSKNPNTKNKILKHLIECPIIGTSITNIITSKYNIRLQFKKSYFYISNSYQSKFVDAFYEACHINESNNKFVLSSNLCQYNNVNICSALEHINNSIYIIQGSERNIDCDRLLTNYKKYNASIEGSIINKTKELPHIENPEAILEVLSIYLH